VIALKAASLRLGGREILRDLDVRIGAGECVAICGPNGAGKSTLLRGLAGLLPGTPGRDPRRVAYVPQGARSAWGITVAEVAMLGRLPHGDRDEAAVARALGLCGVAGLAGERIDRVSGGQARRAMLARAFATEPEVLLLDEPTADLDPAAQHAIMGLLRETARAGGCVVVVLHGLDLAVRYASRMLVIDGRRVQEDAAPVAAMAVAARCFGLPFGVDPSPRLLPP
jgi:ABC-type cobalamin/Fe3+-siderophores transport system ATPase subunit